MQHGISPGLPHVFKVTVRRRRSCPLIDTPVLRLIRALGHIDPLSYGHGPRFARSKRSAYASYLEVQLAFSLMYTYTQDNKILCSSFCLTLKQIKQVLVHILPWTLEPSLNMNYVWFY